MPNIERYILLTPEEKKLCPKCGEANEFYKGTYYPRGVSFLCKVCLSKRRKESVARHPETFGFIPLNTYRDGDEAHHINKELVIYIPKSIHKSIHHSVLKNKNMDKINSVAFSYLHWT